MRVTVLATPAHIIDALEHGALVVASNARAARALRLQYGLEQRTRGTAAWPAAQVLHWDGWLDSLWRECVASGFESRLLLSSSQEQRAWVRVVKPSIAGRRLISSDGVAELAREAYGLLCAYEASDFLETPSFAGQDVEAFREWARSFEATCLKEGWVSRGLLPSALRAAVLAGRLTPPRNVLLLGFDRLTPAQESLLAACEGEGMHIRPVRPEPVGRKLETRTVAASDLRDEINTCAWWLRNRLSEGVAGRLAVMVPNVQAARREIERIFRDVLAPGSAVIAGPDALLPFEFSLGAPLAQVPMVRAALLLLHWMDEPIDQEDVSWLLLSGFLLERPEDVLQVGAFDYRSRSSRVLPPRQSLDGLLRRGSWQGEMLMALRQRLRNAKRIWTGAGKTPDAQRLSFSAWVERARETLETAGWPGCYALESSDYQAQQRWSELLDGLASLDFDASRVDRCEFVELLSEHAGNVVFAPESHDAPVQILGPFEAAGQSFDACWFLGADDQSWPAPARPHPFLPASLQRQRGMPHADNDEDWQLAMLVSNRIAASATELVFSYSRQNKDGEVRPSTVLARGPAADSAHMRLEQGAEERATEPQVQDELEPATVVPWPHEQGAGGAYVLKMQSACPFQSFASVRLQAAAPDRAEWGLNAMQRGILVHAVLQTLWGELKSRAGLLEKRATGELDPLIEQHVRAVLQSRKKDEAEEPWSRAYLEHEQSRMCALIQDWLACEQQRTDFTVEACEKKMTVDVGGLQLAVRADRVDLVNNGRLLIDYKTGKVSSALWQTDRPEDPQLPLYAAFGDLEHLCGVLFAQVRRGELKLDGHVQNAIVDVGAAFDEKRKLSDAPYSEAMREEWKCVLLGLAQGFLDGDARVDPRDPVKTCTYCELKGLCRVAEMSSAVDEGPYAEDA